MDTPETTLQRFIYGKPVNEDAEAGEFDILAITDGISAEDAVLWRSLAVLEPMPLPDAVDSQAMGVFSGLEANLILARAYNYHGDPGCPVYEYALVPRGMMQAIAGDLQTLNEITGERLDVFTGGRETIEPLTLPDPVTWVADRRTMLYQGLINDDGSEIIETLFTLFDALIDERQLLIQGADQSLDRRLDLVQAVSLLVPSTLRGEITFATHVTQSDKARARLIFAEDDSSTDRWVVNVADMGSNPSPPESSFGALLRTMWQGDLNAFVAELRALELMAAARLGGESLVEGLDLVAARQVLDMQVIAGDAVPVEQVQDVLENAPPEPGPLRTRYIRRLLDHALESRDNTVSDAVAAYMDADEKIDGVLNNVLEERLEEEPDSVYSFVRARLNQDAEGDRWLLRLHKAASLSLEVAIADGDNETLLQWLRLLAREPQAYGLKDVLHTGIDAARSRAHEDGEFGSLLLTFCMRRVPDFVDELLADEVLVEALAAPLGPALREYDPEAVLTVLDLGREVALVLLGRAVMVAPDQREAAKVFAPAAVELLWEMYVDDLKTALPDHYAPHGILRALVETGPAWLSTPSLEILTGHIIVSDEDELLMRLCAGLATAEKLFPMLTEQLASSTLDADDHIRLLGRLGSQGLVTAQESVNVYIDISKRWNWVEKSLPLVEKAARMLQKEPQLDIPDATLWRMLDVAAGEKVELVGRVASRRLLTQFEALDDDAELIHQLRLLHEKLRWSSGVRGRVLNWWRAYISVQPLARLHQLDRALDGKRLLDDSQSVVQTTLAVRKMMGGRSLVEFAQAINTTFSVLEDLSDSFDPAKDRGVLDFDQATVRAELDAQVGELEVDERSVLAKNLKELAQVVIHMAEQRSKATLIRREDNIERQLLSGEQEPHSAVDTMKWLSGYLSGLQNNGDEE